VTELYQEVQIPLDNVTDNIESPESTLSTPIEEVITPTPDISAVVLETPTVDGAESIPDSSDVTSINQPEYDQNPPDKLSGVLKLRAVPEVYDTLFITAQIIAEDLESYPQTVEVSVKQEKVISSKDAEMSAFGGKLQIIFPDRKSVV
jgi:hypothetical protein